MTLQHPRCHLVSRVNRALSRIPTYPRHTDACLASQNTRQNLPLTAPSAVHLTACVLSGSQHPKLSLSARSVFISASTVYDLFFLYYMRQKGICQILLLEKISKASKMCEPLCASFNKKRHKKAKTSEDIEEKPQG